jgi:hypothetical protein
MGRIGGRVATVDKSNCIDIGDLKRSGFFNKDICVIGSISWADGNEIGVETFLDEEEFYLKLHYQSNKKQFEYKVYIDSVPSNLGVGRVLYFLCPETGRRCKKLYRTYGMKVWMCREAFSKRIYYKSQLSSKNDYYNDRYWYYKRTKLPQLLERCKNSHYKGKPTRAILNYEKACEEMAILDSNRLMMASRFILKLKPIFSL